MSSGGSPIPDGTKRIVIFDTNAYRVFAHGSTIEDVRTKAKQLRSCEQQAGVFVLASPIVVWELVAHLADPADPALPHCLNAIIALAEHALSPIASDGGICVFADSESTICWELFRRELPENVAVNQNIGSLVTYISKDAPDLTDSVAVQNIKTIAAAVESKEQAWLNQMKIVVGTYCGANVAKVVFGGRDDNEALRNARAFFDNDFFMETWASWLVATHATKANYTINSPEEFREKTTKLRKEFPVSFYLMSSLLKKLATPQPPNLDNPKRKRWNFVWDSMITFSIGPTHEIGGAPMYLVTGDREIFEAATAAGSGDRVLTLDNYLNSVGFP
jgi:hypothetical protein